MRESRRFLITTWPFAGHFYPQVAVAHALRARGHQVAFYTGEKACSIAREEGFTCFGFDKVDEAELNRTMFHPDRGSMGGRGLLRFKTTLRRWLLETIPGQVADLDPILDAWKPDVLVSDPTFWSPYLIFHEKRGIPVAVSSFVPGCMVPGTDAPPFGLGLPSPRSIPTRLLSRAVGSITDLLASGFRGRVNELRGMYGLEPITISVTQLTGRMPLYLVPSAPEFDYERRDLPPSVHYVGPCIWNRPRNEPPATWLDDLPRDRPWVHVTEGTMHVEEPMVLQAAARGLVDDPVEVIMTYCGDRDPKQLGLEPLGRNVHLARWISHSELLPLTDVVVTTGGAGTVLATLQAGIPLLIVPTGLDKPEIARRVIESGAGLKLSPGRCTPARLRAAVNRLLHEPNFKLNARRLAAVFKRHDGPSRAAELLDALANEARHEDVAAVSGAMGRG